MSMSSSISNMDSSSSSPAQNWLAFSLSNHPSHLLHSFNSSSPPGSVVATRPQEDAPAAVSVTATDLSIFTGGAAPKLENFLGSCGVSPVSAAATTVPQTQPQLVSASQTELYDSELKTIAASFLRGFATDNAVTLKHASPVSADQQAPKKAVDTFGQRTSIYRGVTRHRWTGRYEAHLWDNSCRREGQSRKGRQVYLGGYDKEEKAARAYDLAALKYWGPTTTTNFPISEYEKELEEMKHMTRQEFVASLRRKSSGFSRGASIYRGVTRHHQHGRWQARIGRVAGNKDLYLGTFSTQEEAAEAYDIAAIKFRGLGAVTNFDMSRYDVKSIMSSNLPIGGMSGKSKNSSDSPSDNANFEGKDHDISSSSSITFASQPPSSTLNFALPMKQDASDYWSNILGYQNNNNAKTSSAAAQNLFQSSTIHNPTAFNMEFSAGPTTTVSESNNNALLGTRYNVQQQTNNTTSSTSSIPAMATPIGLNSNNNSSYEYSSWGSATSLHALPTVKPGLSVFQTPIFGIE